MSQFDRTIPDRTDRIAVLEAAVDSLMIELKRGQEKLDRLKALRKLKRECKKHNIDARVLTYITEELDNGAT